MAQEFQAVFKSEGDNVDYTPGGSVDAGEVILLGSNLVTIATSDIAANAPGTVRVSGIVDMVIKSESFSIGDALHWHVTGDPLNGTAGTGALTKTGADGPFAGWAIKAATGGTDEKISMLLRSVSDASAESIGLVDLNDITGAVTYTAGKLLIGDGDSFESVAISGAATLAANGTLTSTQLLDLATTAGVGITGTADSFASYVEKFGTLFKTTIVIDVDGLNSGGTADDIIGADGVGVAHLGQITAARNGTIFAVEMMCLETPAGGDDDIDLWSADEDSGVEDTGISALSNGVQLTDGGDLTSGSFAGTNGLPVANQYLYLVGKTGDADATYTAGILRIVLWGK